jgi:CelD/BcsL family acetyltransferase involved in cellulose biosynthesis
MAIQAARAFQAGRLLRLAEALRRAHDDADSLKSLERGWELLAARAASPMQRFAWAQAFAEAYRDAVRLRVLSVGPLLAPSALAALVQRGVEGRLEALGVRELYEPMDLLYAEPRAARELAEALLREGRAVSLPRIPADSALIGALQAAWRGRGLVRVSPAPGYPYIELDSGWTEPERRFNAGRRSDFRRALRHAEGLGTVSFEVLAPGVDALPQLLEEAWSVEAAGWKGSNGSALASDARRGGFFRRYAAAACRDGILRLCFMRVDGRPAAMQLATECGGRFWLFKIGHDEKFARCAPGNLLMLHTVRYAAQRGLQSYEFLGVTEAWTQLWTRSLRECAALRAYPLTARGMAALAIDGAGCIWRRLRPRT